MQTFQLQSSSLSENTYAEYAFVGREVYGTDKIEWSNFYIKKTNKIPVRFLYEILDSDEAIVAVFSHEMHELNELRRIFAERGGYIRMGDLSRLMDTMTEGNLHYQAWDVADSLVKEMRK